MSDFRYEVISGCEHIPIRQLLFTNMGVFPAHAQGVVVKGEDDAGGTRVLLDEVIVLNYRRSCVFSVHSKK